MHVKPDCTTRLRTVLDGTLRNLFVPRRRAVAGAPLSFKNSFRKVAKAVLPPIFVQLAAGVLRPRLGAPWDGVYADRRDVPEQGAAFQADEWLEQLHASLDAVLTARDQLGRVPRELVDVSALGSLAATFQETVKILDFGGGIGTTYVALRGALAPHMKLDYAIKELPPVAEAGLQRLQGAPGLRFLTENPPEGEPFDIVHVRTALQYVDDYASLLRRFAGHQPKYLLLMALAAGPQPTFASAQVNHRGSRIGYWFHNEGEIVRLMGALGYRLGYAQLLGEETRQGNLPPSHRIGRPRDLVFVREP